MNKTDISVKLCGFTNQESIKQAVLNGAHFIGFVFCNKSPRNISPQKAGKISSQMPGDVKKVAVIVDESDENIKQIVKYLKPDLLQLHGKETPQRVAQIKDKFQLPVIKAFKITNKESLNSIKNYQEISDYFLFDAKSAGGGEIFDWNILKNINIKKDYFLSGGLNINNINEALGITKAKMIDLSSGIEEKKGIKSLQLIKEFLYKINNINQ
jgi:phosphoribosylanthranilate isomerase